MDIYISQLDETKKVLPIIEKYDVGLEVVQFASPFILDDKKTYIESYKKELGDILNYIDISIHGPFADLIPGSRDNMIRKITDYRFEQSYYVAKALNAKKIVYHHGYTPKTYSNTEWLNNSNKFWNNFLKNKLDDIQIHIENTLEDDYFLINKAITEVNNPNFSVCLDIGHVNVYSHLGVNKWIYELGDKIKHMHIHNNYGDKDSHSSIIKGNMNIIEILNLVKEKYNDTSISLEIVNTKELEESLEILYEHGLVKKR
ncbi:sugar phosphate isomerase/epimerase [Romboutsia maritimum]|uniref:Sugar phosphate isomerase/epimerase n=1 Tax=Romboutsia maritimum TaxID=2020948 RepID=A0A371IW28_9FIRM|nr:TIM barrel protein [Romboutsia maritimum]RDY24685.1 sugar phosphate isomerase/epimerase [Romboutsia maritimum]